MHLYSVALITAFAPRSTKPLRATMLRIAALAAVALGMGFLLSRGIDALPLASLPHSYSLVFTALFAVQLTVLCALLAASGLTIRLYKDTFARWLMVLPVTHMQRWVALMIPSFVLAVLATMLAAWPLGVLFTKMGMHPWLLLVAGVGGALSALGQLHALPARHAALRLLAIPGMLWVEYKLLGIINNFTADNSKLAASIAFLVCIGLLIAAFIMSSRYTRSAVTRLAANKTVTATALPPTTWFAKKMARSPSILVNYAVAMIMNIAATAAVRHYSLDTQSLAIFCAIIIAAFTSDIRALARRIAPAEIAALRGSIRFTAIHAVTAGVCSIPLALPLLWAGSPLHIADAATLTAGWAAGIFAGTLLTPAARDISSQFLAALLCVGILILLPQLPFMRSSDTLQPLTYTGLGAALLAASFAIEYHRNRYTWRNYHAHHQP